MIEEEISISRSRSIAVSPSDDGQLSRSIAQLLLSAIVLSSSARIAKFVGLQTHRRFLREDRACIQLSEKVSRLTTNRFLL